VEPILATLTAGISGIPLGVVGESVRKAHAGWADTLRQMSQAPISFARGAPALSLIPADELAECAHAAALREGASLFAYGPGGGYAPLREWVAGRHAVDARRVVLTVGGLLGFALYLEEALARRPGRVLVEAPCYDRPLKLLARRGVDVVALPMDDEGLDLDALARELRRDSDPPSFLYTIPTFQNPSGRTLSAERRRALAELAREHRLAVLEDDPYGLVRFEGTAPPSLHELEGGEHVTYTSSFSKTVAPGLRTGYFVLPEAEAAGFEERAVSTYISPPFLVQAAIAEFIDGGRFEPNLGRVRAELRARRDAMLDTLERTFPANASWNRPEGGYFVWLVLDGADTSELAARAADVGVGIVPGSDFFPDGSSLGTSSARLAFSYESPVRIAEGVERLAQLF
jgi:2-aminoadipate transaminase